MKKNILGIFLIVMAIFTGAMVQSGCGSRQNSSESNDGELKGTISISGAFALYPLTVRWAEEFQKEYPDVRIDISAGGAGKGMADVLSGMVDLAMFSREITPPEIEKGAWWVAVSKDAVLATINAGNPFLDQIRQHGISKEAFIGIFLDQNIKLWNECPGITGESDKINVFTRSDACGAAEMWGLFLGKNQESLKGIGVFGDPGIADAVKNDKLGLGYNNVIYAYDINTRKKYDGIEIVPIDMNGNGIVDPEEDFYGTLDEVCAAIADYRYPSPPARDLYLVSKGKPDNKLVIEFLHWILVNGQQYVSEAGYVHLSDTKIENELQKLK
ncbi:MAG: PstS family phosphate ABC transporter substrate-binding protein [Bacteroidales bacterium]|nr:PstS family phosphate ABC transporter substrate-binding protein [Bacteroidales bacterium]